MARTTPRVASSPARDSFRRSHDTETSPRCTSEFRSVFRMSPSIQIFSKCPRCLEILTPQRRVFRPLDGPEISGSPPRDDRNRIPAAQRSPRWRCRKRKACGENTKLRGHGQPAVRDSARREYVFERSVPVLLLTTTRPPRAATSRPLALASSRLQRGHEIPLDGGLTCSTSSMAAS